MIRQFKDPVIIAIVIILFIVLAGSFRQNRVLSGKNEALRIEEANMELKLQEVDIEAKNKIKAYEDKIAELDGAIDSSNTVISNLEEESSDLESKIKSLESSQANIKDKDELIQNLQSQVNLWKERFTLARAEIAEKDKIIFSLTEGYQSARGIILEKDKQILARNELLTIKDLRIAGLEKKIKADNFWGKIKGYAIVGAGIYILVDIMAGAAH